VARKAKALAGEVFDHGQDPELAAVGQGIAHEIHGSALVQRLRDWRRSKRSGH